jgi:NAD(P)H-flavin reductase
MANPIKILSFVKSVEKYGEGVYKVRLTPSKRLPRFKAGQFLHLTVDPYDPQGGWWPESRVFSIASNSTEEDVTIVYSVKGKYTKKMQEELVPDKEVWLKLPYGDFSIQPSLSENRDIILVAGGTGVSPYIPFINKEMVGLSEQKIKLIYGIRKPEHLLFKDVYENVIGNVSNFSLDLFIEQESIDNLIIGANQITGIISLSHILNIIKELKNPTIFLSGPPKMIQTFKSGLIEKGINSDSIKIDEWE